MKLIYVAGPYYAPTAEGRKKNIRMAERHSISLIRQGYAVFTPHKNTAGYEYYEDGEILTKDTWMKIDLETLSRCDAIYMMPGWESSEGAKIELGYAGMWDLEVIYGERL